MKALFPYGLDAPPVVRNLAFCAFACWLAAAASFAGWLPITGWSFIWPALCLSFSACSMLWSSRYGKLRRREYLLDKLTWGGDERVLDIGCGRGLMAIAAARRLPLGQVIGVDIWQQQDLSHNGAHAVAINAAQEGVAQRVSTCTADMRELPFADDSIHTVVSSTAIHNIYDSEGRNRAIQEIARVVKPSGQILIDDIRHLPHYARCLREAGFELTLTRGMHSWFWRIISFGNLAPGTLVGKKPASRP